MGLFEENPWLLVVLIIITVEVWSLVKAFVLNYIRQRQKNM